MSEADAEIVFKAKIDAEDFNKDIERLSTLLKEKKAQIDNLKRAYADLSSGKTKPQEQIRLEEKLNSLLEKRKDISDSLNFKKVSKTSQNTLVTQLNDIDRQIPKVQNALDKIKIKPTSAQSVRDLARELNLAEKEASKLSNALNQSMSKLSGTQLKQAKEATRMENEVVKMQIATQNKMSVNRERAEAAAARARERIQARVAMNVQNIASREYMFEARMAERKEREKTRIAERESRERTRLSEKAAKEQSKAEEKAAKLSQQRAESFKKSFAGAFKSLLSPITSAINGVMEFGKRILRLGSYVLVFSLIRSGFKQLKDYIFDSLKTNDSFVNSLNQIKSNLMVAFYPIYQYILPAINTLMNALVKASAYFAQFMSMLTGKSIQESQAGAKALYERTQASKDNLSATEDNIEANKKNADSIKDEKAAFDKLGKSIKGGSKELASFDKLNVLNQDKEKKKQDKEKKPKAKKDDFVFSPTTAFDSNYDKILEFWGKLGEAIDNIRTKASEIGSVFKQGFDFGFVDNDISELQTKLSKIGEHLKEIFTNPEIQQNANTAFMALTEALGSIVGAVTSIGVTIAKALLGGVEKFLAENKGQIIQDLNSFFNVTIDFSNFITQFSNAAANIFSVFGNEASQQIISDSLTILYDVFVRWGLLLLRFFSDLTIQIFKPFITHQEDIKKALEGTLEGLNPAFDGIKKIFNDFTDFLEHTYNVAIKPILEELGKIWDDVFGDIVESWNTFVNPVIKKAGDAIKDLAEKHISPIIDVLKELSKSFTDTVIPAIKILWGILRPFVRWFIDTFVAIITENISWIVGVAKNAIEDICTLFKGMVQIVTGVYDILAGLFTGNWDRIWSGAGKIVKGFGNGFIAIINSIISAINSMTSGIITGINTVIDSVNSFHFDLPDWLGGGKFGLNIQKIPEWFAQIPKVPELAQGAVLKGGNPILAYLNDQPRGQTNIETPLDTMIQAFKSALSSNEASYNNNITIQANGDLNSIISLLDFKIKQNNQRIGTNYVTGDVWI